MAGKNVGKCAGRVGRNSANSSTSPSAPAAIRRETIRIRILATLGKEEAMIPKEAIEAAAKALYEVYPSLDDPDDETTAVPWESASEQRREEDTAQAVAVLKAVGYL